MPGKNAGKVFEEDFRDSVPKDAYYLRLHDSATGFDVGRSTQRFSLKSPYDCIVCRNGQMWCFELKSTKGKSIQYAGHTPKIKIRQIEELIKAKKAGAKSYLVLNFRNVEKTYLIDPEDFTGFTKKTGKKSISVHEAEGLGLELEGKRKRVRYRYDLGKILKG